ncbi:MAG: hypothetical protein ACR2F8_09255 [Caulobacteraceae bacterium]
MWLATALAVSSFFYSPHHGRPQVARRLYAVHGWRIAVDRDTFTGAVSCSLSANRVYFRSGALIFRLGRGVETTHAVFRLDGGPARPVAEAFHDDEARGIFPRRGWIDDPAGGDVALPAAYIKGAKRVWIRSSPATYPRLYDVSRFAAAREGARGAGCGEGAFVAAA